MPLTLNLPSIKTVLKYYFNPDYAIGFVIACPDTSGEVISSRYRLTIAYFGFNLKSEMPMD